MILCGSSEFEDIYTNIKNNYKMSIYSYLQIKSKMLLISLSQGWLTTNNAKVVAKVVVCGRLLMWLTLCLRTISFHSTFHYYVSYRETRTPCNECQWPSAEQLSAQQSFL